MSFISIIPASVRPRGNFHSFSIISGVQETFVEIETDDTQNRILKAYFMSEAEFRERFSGAPESEIEAAIAPARNRPA